MLGAATLVKEKPPNLSQASGLPHVVMPRLALVKAGIPAEAFALSMAFEGLSLVPYDDNGKASGGTWTIGYGSTHDATGSRVTASTKAVTEADARALKTRDFAVAEARMVADFPDGLPPRWWAVGLLMANNLGRMSVWGPTLRAHLRASDWQAAAKQLGAYRNQRDAEGRLLPLTGLRRRRWAEAAYALGMDAKEAKARAWAEIMTPGDWPRLPSDIST